MPLTSSSKNLITLILIPFLVIVIVGYSLFSARHLIIGPRINISNIKDGDTVKSAFIDIRGTTNNLSYISMNDRPIFITENGEFEEKVLLFPGYNIISFYGKDRFGREVRKQLRLISPPEESKPAVVATSTATTTSLKK